MIVYSSGDLAGCLRLEAGAFVLGVLVEALTVEVATGVDAGTGAAGGVDTAGADSALGGPGTAGGAAETLLVRVSEGSDALAGGVW